MTFKDGRVTNPRFSEYRVPRMEDVPELDIVLVDRPDLASLGAGETPIIAVAPAIANAICHARRARRKRCAAAMLRLARPRPASWLASRGD